MGGGQVSLSVQARIRAPHLWTGAHLLCDVPSPGLQSTKPRLSEPDAQASCLLCGSQKMDNEEMHFKRRVANAGTTYIYIAQMNTFVSKYVVPYNCAFTRQSQDVGKSAVLPR